MAVALLLGTAPLHLRAEAPAQPLPVPPWAERAGAVRSGDPALARGKGVVQWRVWGADAFAEADRTHKPLYVFVSANWCHGGREMERSTLSNLDVANRLNADFIPVRLDRDAFPETDLRLQQAVAALKGVRGWPLNVFLFADGEICFGATFMQLDDDLETNRPGMKNILEQFTQRWHDDRTRITREAGTFCGALKRSTEQASLRGPIPPDIAAVTALALDAQLDTENGGFLSPSPAQFPEPRALELCLAHYARTGSQKSLELVETTLNRMLDGGIYDQLEGGFHRFCADKRWLLPRFEKMPLLNAEMICVLLHAWQATGNGRYRSAAEECLAFWRGELDADGKFFCASVAPEARSFEDGAYYSWSQRDIEALFDTDTDVRLACLYYGIGESGNQVHSAPDRSVLHVARSLHDVALETGLSVEAARKRLEFVRARMRAARALRPLPPRDRTPLCDANAMLAAAFIESGRLFGREDFTAQGFRTLNAILKERAGGAESARPVRHVLEDPASPALAMDESARAWACLQAYESTGDKIYTQLAAEALDRLDANYRDLLRGGYIERSFKGTPDFARALNWRTKSVQDTSEPSTQGMIAQVFVRMAVLTSDPHYLERARAAIEAVGAVLNAPSPYNATLAEAADAIQNGVLRIKVIGRANDPACGAMLALVQARYFPWKSAMRFDTPEAAGEVPIANLDGKTAFAVVDVHGDKLVAESLDELNKILNEAANEKK